MDISISNEKNIFRLRAAAVIVRDNSILMVTNSSVDYYYSVGGAVEMGEKVEDCVVREVFEETGLNLEIDRLLFVHQNYFKIKGEGTEKDFHEVAFYFLMKYNGGDITEGITTSGLKENLEWISFEKFDEITIFPKFLPDFVKNNREFEVITTKE